MLVYVKKEQFEKIVLNNNEIMNYPVNVKENYN